MMLQRNQHSESGPAATTVRGEVACDAAGTFADMLELVLQERPAEARQALATLLRLHPATTLRARLNAMISAPGSVRRIGHIFVIGAPTDVPLEQLCSAIARFTTDIARDIGRSVPVLWIEFNKGSPNSNFTYADFPGVRRMSFSRDLFTRDAPVWLSLVCHECAHAMLMARCRFLDEGWAVWCQYAYTDGSVYPATKEELDTFSLPPVIATMPIAAVLRSSMDDMTFRRLARTDDEQRAVYVRACRFFDALRSRLGLPAVADLFERLWEGADPLAELNRAGGKSVAALEPFASPTMQAADRVFRALRCSDALGAAQTVIPFVRTYLASHPDDCETWKVLGRMLGEALSSAGRKGMDTRPIMLDLATVRERLAGFRKDDPHVSLLRMYEVLGEVFVAQAIDDTRRSKALAAIAERHLLEAEARGNGNADVALTQARFELRKPAPDRASILEFLALAARDADCLEEAVALATSLRFVTTPVDVERGVGGAPEQAENADS
jgi:hypothetical protein